MDERLLKQYLATGEHTAAMDEAPLSDLQKHDKRFHPKGYKEGDSCKYREAMARGDKADELVKAESEEREAQKHTIFTTDDEDPDLMFQDEMINLDKELDGNILVIADLGLWNGRKSGYRVLGNNLNEVLKVGQGDFFKVYYDEADGDIKADDTHHDGTNHYVFREIDPSKEIDDLTDKIYDGTYTAEDIDKYTKPLGGYVCDIYGWRKKEPAPAKKQKGNSGATRKIKHWSGYGTVKAKVVSSSPKELVVDVWGNHERGLERKDPFDVFDWLVKRFDDTHDDDRDILSMSTDVSYEKEGGEDVEKCRYTIKFR